MWLHSHSKNRKKNTTGKKPTENKIFQALCVLHYVLFSGFNLCCWWRNAFWVKQTGEATHRVLSTILWVLTFQGSCRKRKKGMHFCTFTHSSNVKDLKIQKRRSVLILKTDQHKWWRPWNSPVRAPPLTLTPPLYRWWGLLYRRSLVFGWKQ